ncbi:MAG: B-box zinc finger protein [Verrucomicrobiae bacterium]|nr:B-box zinc finger protein [Verrucomicrobiae bacterium]
MVALKSLRCGRCDHVFEPGAFDTGLPQKCPKCGALTEATLFPARHRIDSARPAETIVDASESSCFYHPDKKAAAACDSCGRFLCSLCDVEFHGRHLCPVCIEAGAKKGKIANLDRQRVLWDQIALALVFITLLLWPVTLVTAPAAIYISIRHWNTPTSLVRGGRWYFVIASFLGVIELVGWGILFYLMFRHR